MILTLCGSAKFEPFYHEANKQLGLAGHICFSLMTFPSIEGDKTWYTEDQKWTLDLAHFAKIEESDGVVMLNVGGYLGESSLRELKWARMRNKRIFWSFKDKRMPEPNYQESFARELLYPWYEIYMEDWVELEEAVKKKQETLDLNILKS